MLKIENIRFNDSEGKTYLIRKNQLESFPLVGGESADMITTKSWNQHGNTPINALIETFEGELIFIIKTGFMKADQIEEERRKITNICNPLNGIIRMTVTLNNGSIYHRDITFVSAPIFPIGFENRNRDWQKVQLLYSANNPFWYAENEIIETFQGVEPLFEFPFEFTGRTDFNGVKSYFVGKLQGSSIENPNEIHMIWQPELPTDMTVINSEVSQAQYDGIMYEGGLNSAMSTATAGNRPIYIFKYNILEILERKYGIGIWEGETTTAGKIAKAIIMIKKLTYKQRGFGAIEGSTTIPKTRLGLFKPSTNTWSTWDYDWNDFTTWGIYISNLDGWIDENGIGFFALTMDASDGTNTHKLYCDWGYCEFDLVLNNQGSEISFGNVIPSNVATNEGQVDAPIVIEIRGACVNPRIVNESTGEFIAFKNLTMVADDVLVIDTTFGQKKVELNGVNVFNKLDFASTFFNLQIGDNAIDFSDETGTNETEIHFKYRNLYITI